MASGPPPIPAPPPPKQTSRGERGTFNAFINAHKALKPYAGQIWTWANNYGGITPTELAATLWFESGGKADAKSSVGALGLAQIFDTKANPTNAAGVPFFRPDRNISAQDKTNPAFAIQYAAWRLSGAVQKYGSIDQAYLHDYNPGYTGSFTPISSVLPKGYVGTPAATATQTAGKSVDTSAVKAAITDPWVVQTPKGGFKYVFSSTPPKDAVKYAGQPITRTQFNQVWTQTYQDQFYAFTGRQARPGEIAKILANPPSVYGLQNQLAESKDFTNSPVYKQHAPGLVALARQTLGSSWKPSGGIIRKAIAQGWDQATFQAHLQQLPDYVKGPEFQTNKARLQSQYEAIYGKADPGAHTLINEVTLQGWSPDEFASWLRSQDAYKQTPEYQSKAVSFLSNLGLITGAVPTASAATPTVSGPVGPNSQRIPGQGSLTGNGLVVNGA